MEYLEDSMRASLPNLKPYSGGNQMLNFAKRMLSRAGTRLSERTVYNLNAAVSYLETGRWLRAHGFQPSARVAGTRQLIDRIVDDVRDKKVLYLEFGVYRGESMRYWSSQLRNPEANLHGFDSFEGLPENWNIDSPRGRFTTNGTIPHIEDSRVKFFKGWFDDTLPLYQMPSHDRLVLYMDADLYSSTIYVLNTLRTSIVPGTYIYFDEFADRANELRAFAEFLNGSKSRFEFVAATPDNAKVVFQCVSD